jgi:hypothetical protein
MRWEYMTVNYVGIELTPDEWLNQLGSTGWQLCAVYRDTFIFKREK